MIRDGKGCESIADGRDLRMLLLIITLTSMIIYCLWGWKFVVGLLLVIAALIFSIICGCLAGKFMKFMREGDSEKTSRGTKKNNPQP